ncbi:MAG: alpha-glycosidase [Haloplasmataceae bacterium]|jgi:glycosidase|nr:alpha-glycosidase [Haloplasmataceae bacterium]
MLTFNLAAVYHEAKSKYAYAYDSKTVHIKIRTAKDDVEKIRFIFGDPFNWGKKQNKDVFDKDTNEYVWLYEGSESMYMLKEYTTDLYDYWFISVKPKYRRMKYIFVLEKQEDKLAFGCRTIVDIVHDHKKAYDLFNYFNFPFINEIDIFKGPEWVKDTIWYQIFPERFCNGNKENDPQNTLPWNSIDKVTNDMFFGGDLQGVIEKLDYIKDLGANGIYFTPLFRSPSIHKYDTTDYFEIDPQFGDLKTIKILITEAHKRGIKVMLDAVFNHSGFYHPFFKDVLKNGEASQYKDYFHIKKYPVYEGTTPIGFKFIDGQNELNFDTFAFTPAMPKWNTENPEVIEYLLHVGEYWIKECDIDAWRLDVSNEVDHAFWKKFRKTCDQAKADFFIVGENWDDSTPWLQPDQMSSVMNYQFTFPVLDYIGRDAIKASKFKQLVSKVLSVYPKNVSPYLFNLLDSHDTTRILTVCDNNKLKAKLAYVFLLSYGGTPSIYYGGEVALAGGHDPDNRRCMIWDEETQDLDMFKFMKKLIELRKNHPAFKSIDLSWIDTNDETNHIVYKKQAENETIYIVLNNQNQKLNLLIDELKNELVVNLYTNEVIDLTKTIEIDAYDFIILKR